MELLLKNVQEKHLGLIAELARTLKINIEGLTDKEPIAITSTRSTDEMKKNLEDGLFHSWINK